MLKLRIEPERVEVEMECETCGYKIVVPWSYVQARGEPETIECSTCGSIRKEVYKQKKLREAHSIRLEDLDRLPPMINIDTRDLPGFVDDKVAKNIGKTLELFK